MDGKIALILPRPVLLPPKRRRFRGEFRASGLSRTAFALNLFDFDRRDVAEAQRVEPNCTANHASGR